MTRCLAIEGGASSTRAGLYDADRRLLSQTTAGPSNPLAYGLPRSIEVVTSLAKELLGPAPSEVAVAAGISGASKAEVRDELARALYAALARSRTLVTDDLRPLLYANIGEGEGVLVIAGTGSSVLAQAEDGSQRIIGGRGAVFGDDGSAYQLAVAALRAAARAVDAIGPETRLTEALVHAAGLHDFAEFTAWTARAEKRRVAELAPAVTALAIEGDAVAMECVRQQAVLLAEQAAAALQSCASGAPVLLNGGLLERCAVFRGLFETSLRGKAPDSVPTFPALRGHRAVLELAYARRLPPGVSVYPP